MNAGVRFNRSDRNQTQTQSARHARRKRVAKRYAGGVIGPTEGRHHPGVLGVALKDFLRGEQRTGKRNAKLVRALARNEQRGVRLSKLMVSVAITQHHAHTGHHRRHQQHRAPQPASLQPAQRLEKASCA